MRQVDSFLKAMHKRNTTKEYHHLSFFAKLNGAEMPSLDQVLGVASEDENPFSKEQEAIMEERAKQVLKEQQAIRNV